MIGNINDEDRSRFEREGCVLLRGLVDREQAGRLAAAADHELRPYPPGYHIVPSIHEWNPVFHDFVWRSGIARAGSQLAGVDKLRLYGADLFSKDPGEQEPIRWHNDISYYPFSDATLVSIWVALRHVTRDMSALCLIPASHKWKRMFKPHIPSSAASVKAIVESADFEVPPDFADLDARYPGAINIRAWDMEPGDAIAFTGWTLHYTGANLSKQDRRLGYSMRFLGDDAIYDPRPNTLTPAEYRAILTPGQPISGGWPVIWREGGEITVPELMAAKPANKYEALARGKK